MAKFGAVTSRINFACRFFHFGDILIVVGCKTGLILYDIKTNTVSLMTVCLNFSNAESSNATAFGSLRKIAKR